MYYAYKIFNLGTIFCLKILEEIKSFLKCQYTIWFMGNKCMQVELTHF